MRFRYGLAEAVLVASSCSSNSTSSLRTSIWHRYSPKKKKKERKEKENQRKPGSTKSK